MKKTKVSYERHVKVTVQKTYTSSIDKTIVTVTASAKDPKKAAHKAMEAMREANHIRHA